MSSVRKSESIKIRLTREEKEKLRALANSERVKSLADYIRRMLSFEPIISLVDQEMLHELRRQGGLLKTIHNESGGAYSDKTAEMLRVMHKLLTTIQDKINSR